MLMLDYQGCSIGRQFFKLSKTDALRLVFKLPRRHDQIADP